MEVWAASPIMATWPLWKDGAWGTVEEGPGGERGLVEKLGCNGKSECGFRGSMDEIP